jgi:hypothetical protein
MTADDFDRILASEGPIEPSSGFVTDVMAAVHRQAAEPPPLPFPWLRFATGLAACGTMAVSGTFLLPRFEHAFSAIAAPLAPLARVAPDLGYAVAVVIVGIGLVALPRLRAGS